MKLSLQPWRHRNVETAVGGHWEEVGRMQLEFLVGEGVKPNHRLLDVACGSFRGGRHFIDYLDAGCYTGIDKDAALLQQGQKQFLKPAGLLAKNPKIHKIELGAERQDLRARLQQSFDYIWVHALFDHIPPDAIRTCLGDLASVLAESGKLYATIFLNPHGEDFREPLVHPRNGSLTHAVVSFPDREYWHHSLDFFKDALKQIPELRLDACRYDYPHPLGLRVLRFGRNPV